MTKPMITRLLPVSVALAVSICSLTRLTAGEPEDLVARGAEVQKLAGGFGFTEGPARDEQGNVYFSDVRNSRIHKWSVEGELSTFRENTGAANGLYFDRRGNLVACEGGNRRVTSISPDGDVTVLADSYNGKRLNSPNDVWIHPRGGIYFTDPRYGSQQGIEQDGFHVYYIASERKGVVRVIDDLVKPNGVVGNADGKRLYVTDAGDGKTYVYRIEDDGSLTDRTLAAPESADGMTLDQKGNLYLTRGPVRVYNPAGEKITTIEVPESTSNVCFGGKDGRTLFITARTGFYSVRMNVRGQ